ncbi:hypothetical protein [Accumulibacter sp.]|jgi:hypothetical protein|uniref:Uncharacterized protein n=1 Tax=Accumulibacter regalis TaxID=522306 RepID=C7RV24_ACCRE|nr:hypothetical protein [Accumulibacter sp.]MBN8499039.1 hypothetical protein [Accumulibacter sp.]MBO3715032.1 hypothetical protein [Accumulibacter sp.]
MDTKTLLLIALLVVFAMLTGCAYNHKKFDHHIDVTHDQDDFVVQVDDFGQFWDPAEAERALTRVSSLAKSRNVIVVLFVHGWNHDADPKNENLVDFRESIVDTRRRLTDEKAPESAVYRQSRKNLTGTEDLTVVSIYVGWRGRSLPSYLNYTTFWGRKAAAERVGEGDTREFLLRLNSLYRNQQAARVAGTSKTFMGLATIGHSFGAQVLFKAVATEIENELVARTTAASKQGAGQNTVSDLPGFGDLVVLVNPAFEAMQFERIDKLSNQLSYGRQQNPILLVVSSAGDVPRQVLFPLGRQIDALLLRPSFRPGQRALWTQALGEYEPTRTHSLTITQADPALIPGFDPGVYIKDPCAIVNLDLTNVPSVGGVKLTPGPNHRPNNPFIVAYASTSVVLNHSSVFEEILRRFLNDYVAIAQGKRMLTASDSISCR